MKFNKDGKLYEVWYIGRDRNGDPCYGGDETLIIRTASVNRAIDEARYEWSVLTKGDKLTTAIEVRECDTDYIAEALKDGETIEDFDYVKDDFDEIYFNGYNTVNWANED